MKLPAFLERYIVKLAISRSGPLLTKFVSGAAAYAVAYLAAKVPGAENYINEYVVTGLFFVLFDYLYNLIPADIQRRFGAELQDAVNRLRGTHLKVDGYVGPVTVQSVSHELSK
jgi:hypothetical protein